MIRTNFKHFVIILFLLATHLITSAQITPQQAIVQMQKGINMGNTLEPPLEGGWNNPNAQEYYFDLYQEEGFQLVRIPVRWDKHTGTTPPYKVNDTWMNRVEQIVDWGLERGLFIMINSHHDNWIKDNYSDANKARFDSIWTQISLRFKDKSEKLFFEVLNEPHGLSKANNDDMHARILSIIRKTNPTRIVIFQGHEWGGADQLLTAAIPNDDYIIGSFHSYDPYKFGLEGEGTWGTAGDISTLEKKFKDVSDWSLENNVPAFIGEFGAIKTGDYNSRMRHYRTYTTLAQKYGIASAAWDDGGDFRIMERQQHDWNEIKDILLHTKMKSPWPLATVFEDSIVKINWSNYVHDHDSIIIQRKLSTQRQFINLATVKADTNQYYDVKPTMEKTYNYRIIAHYNDTSDLFSHPVKVIFPAWEKKVRKPFNDTLSVIPGIIEAEDFDYGGEGLAYHDADKTNIAGDYRPEEGVDIYDRLGDGFHIGNAVTGEWFEYSVEVKAEGWYDVTFHLAALYGGGTFQLKVDTIESNILTAPTCYSWLNTKPVVTKMYLTQGKKIMRFTILSAPLFNIDKFEFDLKTANSNLFLIKQNPFIAYQNSYGELIIKQNKPGNLKYFNVYTISGSLVFSAQKPEPVTKISQFNFTQGIYLIQGVSENRKYNQKVIIK